MKKKMIIVSSIILFLVIVFFVVVEILNGLNITPKKALKKYTKDKDDLCLTIGVIKNNEMSYMVYGKNNEQLMKKAYNYEIGSISKTITGSLLAKEISLNNISLDETIDHYLPLDNTKKYPTVRALATHTAGYGDYPFDENNMTKEELKNLEDRFYDYENIYYDKNEAYFIEALNNFNYQDIDYGWEYSNFGVATLGLIISKFHSGKTLRDIYNDFMHSDLGMIHSYIGNNSGEFDHYWDWNDDDIYMSTGGIVSNIDDMFIYANNHINSNPDFLQLTHEKQYSSKEVDMGINFLIDDEYGFLWHNGGTSAFTSFLGIDIKNKTSVVIMSNYASDDSNEDELDILGFLLLDELNNDNSNVNNIFDILN